MPPRILIVAGDPSGDHHAAGLVGEIRRRHPEAELHGYGGGHLRAAGVAIDFDLPSLSAIGLWDVLPGVLPARAALRRLLAACEADPPDAAVLVDCGAFNLPLGRRLRELGVPVLGFFPPGSWSRSPKKAERVARAYDAVATPFAAPLEAYAAVGLRAVHMGHPGVEALRARHPDGAARLDPPTLAILPGSRPAEIRYLLPPMLEAARRLRGDLPALTVRVSRAATAGAWLDRALSRSDLVVEPVAGSLAALEGATAALVKSGTVTLEAASLGLPQVVCYRGSHAAYLVASLYVWPRPKYWAMPNSLAQDFIVPQVFQYRATGARLASEVAPLLADTPARARQLAELRRVTEPLARPGALGRAADLLDELLSRGSPAPA